MIVSEDLHVDEKLERESKRRCHVNRIVSSPRASQETTVGLYPAKRGEAAPITILSGDRNERKIVKSCGQDCGLESKVKGSQCLYPQVCPLC